VDTTPLVVILNDAVVEPAVMVTLAGTFAADALLFSVTTAPPAGAAPFSVTVPIELFPPTTDVGFRLNDDKVAALTVRVVVLVTPWVAEMVAEVLTATGVVVIVKVAVREPTAMVTLAGTFAADALLFSVTTAPPAGAAPFSVTVPIELFPPTTDVGFRLNDDKVAALTVRVVVLGTPYVPVITAEEFTATGVVATEKVAVLAPAGTVTLTGT
jgi:hypothetical protein